MDREAVEAAGIPPEFLHELPNGTFVHRDMFVSFGPDANCTLELCPVEWTVYQYRPSIPANATFLALYAVAMLIHVYLGVRWRSWSFMAFMVVGCGFAVIGYAGRIILNQDPWSFGGFMVQMVFVTSGPVLFTAAIYVTLSRAIRFFDPEISRLRPRAIYWTFISADIFCLTLQATGGALSSTSSGSSQAGVDVAMSGLILQVVVLVFFCTFFADYMVRYVRKLRRDVGGGGGVSVLGTRQKLFFGGLATAVVLILVRCAYRVEELSEGYTDSGRITNEPLFIGLEGALMVIATCSLFIGHPGFGLKGEAPAKNVATDASGDSVTLTSFVQKA